MYTGWWPFGVWAFPKGYQKPSAGYGDRELLEGLWYYEDGYSTHPDAYDKRIDELLSKNKTLKRAAPESETRSNGAPGAMPALAQACPCFRMKHIPLPAIDR